MERKSGLVAAVAALLLAAGTGASAAQEAPVDPAQVERIATTTSYLDLSRDLAALVAADPANPLIPVMRARLAVLLEQEIQRIALITSPALLREELARLQALDPVDPLVAIITNRIVVISQPPGGTTRVAFFDTTPY